MAQNRSDIIIAAQNTASKELLAVGRNARAAAKGVDTLTTALGALGTTQVQAGRSAVGFAGSMRVVAQQANAAADALERYNQAAGRQPNQRTPTAPPTFIPPTTPGSTPGSTALVDSEVRAARATGDHARALQLLDGELAKASQGSVRYNQIVAQRAGVERQTTTASTQAQQALNRTADSEVRAARASGDYGRALQIIDAELARTTAGTARYNDLLARHARVSKQAEDGSRSIASAFNGIQAALGAAGIAVGAQQLIQFGVEAFQSSQKLQSTQNVTRVLAGDTARYNQVLDLARQNQHLFGGSLQENIEQLTGFTVAARRSGVSVKELNDLSKRLAILSPEQGASGAAIAINEALSGNASSLVKRFEIPKDFLKGIEDPAKSAAEKLAILDLALNASGVSLEAVNAASTPAQQALNDLGAAFDTLKTNAGAGAAPAIEGVVTKLTTLIGLVNNNPDALAKINAFLGGRSAPNDADKEAGKERAASVSKTEIKARVNYAGGLNDFTDPRADQIATSLAAANKAEGDYAATGEKLLQQYHDKAINAAEFSNRVDILSAAVESGTQKTDGSVRSYEQARKAADDLSASITDQTKGLRDQLTANLEASDAQNALTQAKKDTTALADSVVSGYKSEQDALTALTLRFGDAELAARYLNNEIARITALTAAQGFADQRAGERSGGQFGTQAQANAAAAADKARAARARDLAAAQAAQIQSTGTATQKLAALRAELALLPKGTDLYVKKQTEVIAAEQAVAQERQQNAAKAQTAAERAQRSAEEIRKARFDLLSTEQQIADLKQRVASGRLSEVDRLDATKQIRDLEEKITDEREKQTKSAIDARLAALDDRKQQRIELREAAAARRILASGTTSGEQKASAADVLQRIALEQQKRALEIAEKTRDAGGVVPGVSAALPPGGQRVGPAVAALPGGGGAAVALVPLPSATGGDMIQRMIDALGQIGIGVAVYVDGKEIASRAVITLRNGWEAAQSGGTSKH